MMEIYWREIKSDYSMEVAFTRDAFGRISQKYTGTAANDVYQTFTYNGRNLLETAKSVDPTNTTSTLSEVTRTYDSFGNIKSETFVELFNQSYDRNNHASDRKEYR